MTPCKPLDPPLSETRSNYDLLYPYFCCCCLRQFDNLKIDLQLKKKFHEYTGSPIRPGPRLPIRKASRMEKGHCTPQSASSISMVSCTVILLVQASAEVPWGPHLTQNSPALTYFYIRGLCVQFPSKIVQLLHREERTTFCRH